MALAVMVYFSVGATHTRTPQTTPLEIQHIGMVVQFVSWLVSHNDVEATPLLNGTARWQGEICIAASRVETKLPLVEIDCDCIFAFIGWV